MGKTIRSTSKACKDSFESQLMKVKKTIVSSKAEVFMRDFEISGYNVDILFPNQFGETVEQYTQREIKNYQVVIEHLKEIVIILLDPSTDRPIASKLNWIFAAIEHRTELDHHLFSTMTTEQKNTLLQMLIEESEIRLTMLQSIQVPVSFVSPTTESENTMVKNNQEAVEKQAAEEIIDVAEKTTSTETKQTTATAAEEVKPVPKKAERTTTDSVEKEASSEPADQPAQEAEKEPTKPATQPAKGGWKKAVKCASITAATIGAVAGGYWLYKNKFK